MQKIFSRHQTPLPSQKKISIRKILHDGFPCQSGHSLQISVDSRNSVVTIQSNKQLQINVNDKKNIKNIVEQQQNIKTEQRDSQDFLDNQHTSKNNNNLKKPQSLSLKQYIQPNSIIKKFNQLQKFDTNVSINFNDEEAKNQTLNGHDDLKTPVSNKQKQKLEDLLSPKICNINNDQVKIQQLIQQVKKKDIQSTNIQKELSKCQTDLEKEREEKIRLKGENTRINEILRQKQIEIDQLVSKNNTFSQLIKTIDENISQMYQKEVKILVKKI